MNIIFKGSPNFDTNRRPIDRLVLHWFGKGTLSSANNRFQNKDSNVSAHYGISNGVVWQWVKEENVAYHAGKYSMNQRSIGVEHSATTTKLASEETYNTSGQLVREICLRYNIPIDRTHILKHSEVKATRCPGTLDLDRIIRIAKGETMNTVPNWLKTMYQELGIDLTKPEGEIRGRVQEIIDGYKKYGELQKQKELLEKELALARGEAAEAEERLLISERNRGELKNELEDAKKAIVNRDIQISKLQTSLGEFEDKTCLTEEEYKRLNDKTVLKRYTRFQLLREILKWRRW